MNIAPILVENMGANAFNNAIVIPGELNISLLNGHYEGVEFLPPNWYNEIKKRGSLNSNILVIDGIYRISKDDQMKFYELLKYRKISTFDLPENCVIILPCESKFISSINEKLLSLVVHI